ncbi:MAG: TlpA disulfide reductase family protein [Chloroflexi bacterium]|nr:TlpA disulfide reductase family protein [Chloroflexota bacterium]
MPPIEMTTVDGRSVKLSDLKGKRVVINFWATWCPPCRAELPDLARIYEEQMAQGLEVIAVDVQEQEPQVSRYLREIGGLPFTVGMDPDGAISRKFAVGSLPTSFFVDDEGVIRLTFVGGMNASTIQRKLTQIVEEQEYAKSQAQK